MMVIVFVYGTLMRGRINNKYYLSKAEFLGEGEISGYAMYDVSYFPGIVREHGEKVKGELYSVDEDTLKRLDSLEGEGSLYIRKLVDIETSSGAVQAYTYIWNRKIDDEPKVSYESQPWRG